MNEKIKTFYNRNKPIILLILALICVVLDFIWWKIFIKSSYDFILFITFLAILWYSWETKKLREETASQKHLNVFPFLVVKEYDDGLYVVNIGRGPAMWPEVSGDFTIGTPSFLYSRVIPTIFDDPYAKIRLFSISVGELESREDYQKEKENKKNEKRNTIDSQISFKRGEIILKYKDIYEKTYVSKIQLTPLGPYLEEYKF